MVIAIDSDEYIYMMLPNAVQAHGNSDRVRQG